MSAFRNMAFFPCSRLIHEAIIFILFACISDFGVSDTTRATAGVISHSFPENIISTPVSAISDTGRFASQDDAVTGNYTPSPEFPFSIHELCKAATYCIVF